MAQSWVQKVAGRLFFGPRRKKWITSNSAQPRRREVGINTAYAITQLGSVHLAHPLVASTVT